MGVLKLKYLVGLVDDLLQVGGGDQHALVRLDALQEQVRPARLVVGARLGAAAEQRLGLMDKKGKGAEAQPVSHGQGYEGLKRGVA